MLYNQSNYLNNIKNIMTKSFNYEIELRYTVNNPIKFKKRINELGKKIGKVQYQKDTYFIPQHRDFLKSRPIKEWLRIRETLKGNSINYKNWIFKNGKTTDVCKELECNISNPKTVHKILEFLDFKQIVVVEKRRQTWLYNKTKITLDNVVKLNPFVEIEINGKFNNSKEAKIHINRIAKSLKLKHTQAAKHGYAIEILKMKHKTLKLNL